MAIPESPFPNACVSGLHAFGWVLVFPSFLCLDRLIANLKPTTQELQQQIEEECYLRPLRMVFGTLLFFTLFLLWAPLGLLGFLLWAPLQSVRRPFCYYHHHQHGARSSLALPVSPLPPMTGAPLADALAVGRVSLSFATANLCLLPDSLARFNNLSHTQRRAAKIGDSISQATVRPDIRIYVDSPSSCGTLSPSASLLAADAQTQPSYGAMDSHSQPTTPTEPPAIDLSNTSEPNAIPASPSQSPGMTSDETIANSNQSPAMGKGVGSGSGRSGRRGPPRVLGALKGGGGVSGVLDIPVQVSTLFPAGLDLLCLQEVFDKRAAARLRDSLSPVFGHVLYDVGVYACQPCCGCPSTFKFFNSGLFVASRLPLLDAQYHCFPNACGEDALAAKGLLCVKVLINSQEQGNQRTVGYLNCTHLHAPEADCQVRFDQLSMVLDWIEKFQEAHTVEGELVLFDVLCGDLNFDNCSPDDELEQHHSLFEQYMDPCRAGPGQEKPWVIGTLLEQPTLYDEDVRTPERLQRTLEQEDLRKQYLCPPVPHKGTPEPHPEPGKPWSGRRIDYVLYRETTTTKNTHTEVEELTYVTQLAGLTDHIPVGLRLSITPPQTHQEV